jgi:hypothetical protein
MFPVSPQNSPLRPRRIGEKITTWMAAEIGETERKLIVRPGCRSPAAGRDATVDVTVSRCSSLQGNLDAARILLLVDVTFAKLKQRINQINNQSILYLFIQVKQR